MMVTPLLFLLHNTVLWDVTRALPSFSSLLLMSLLGHLTLLLIISLICNTLLVCLYIADTCIVSQSLPIHEGTQYMEYFLFTYRYFMTAEELLGKLGKMYLPYFSILRVFFFELYKICWRGTFGCDSRRVGESWELVTYQKIKVCNLPFELS